MIVEGLFSDSGFWESVLKLSGEKILKNSWLAAVKSQSQSVKLESV